MCQHPKGTFNAKDQLQNDKVVRIFNTAQEGSVWCCHVRCVQVGIVTKNALSRSQNALFKLVE